MKQIVKILALIAVLFATKCVHASACQPFLLYRSQTVDEARIVSGWQQLRTELMDGYYMGHLSLAIDYTRSFDAKALNCALFGQQALTFSGSRVTNRGQHDILADYFGLPTDFQSTVSFTPRISNVIAAVDWYTGLHYISDGLFMHINTALVHADFNLHPCERVVQSGQLNYPAGYMSALRIDRPQLAQRALDSLAGTVTFGDLDTPLMYGRVTGKQTKTKLADIYIGLGSMIASDDAYHVAFSVHTVIPTGTRTHAGTIFEPQIGNGHHWALGVGLDAHALVYECDEWSAAFYAHARIEHLFKSYERRSFDFKNNGPASRYILLQEMGVPLSGTTTGVGSLQSPVVFNNGAIMAQQYHGRIFNAINKTTFNTQIKVDVQADIVLSCVVNYCAWETTVGYNFWGRTHEKLVCRDRLPSNRYAIKGDAQLYGYDIDTFIALNATQQKATIHAGQGDGNASQLFANTNADNAQLASYTGGPLEQSTADGIEGTGIDILDQVSGSAPALFISDADINNASGLAPRGLSNSVFAHISYVCPERCGAIPSIGIGCKAEFGTVNSCSSAVSQWGLWIKGGITY